MALNEDVKVHTLGYEDAQYDYGRINTLLTFAHLIAVLLNRRSLARFAGAFARPPSGMASIPKMNELFNLFLSFFDLFLQFFYAQVYKMIHIGSPFLLSC
ncbi:MAG: hypothetical protein Q8P63_00110 [Candidatus Nealsonbacteria bacterium]|nr:hypothetical protein [Candidatus Nealsonbacteria bacterium]